MKKSPFAIFGVFAAIFVVLLPLYALAQDGSHQAAPTDVPSAYTAGQVLFRTNCGTCHTLSAGGTDGVVGPNLDSLLGQTADTKANYTRVLTAVENGLSGRMPAGLLTGVQAKQVA